MLTVWRIGLVLVICLFAGSAYSNPPAPTPPKAEQKNQTNAQDKQQAPNPDQRGSATAPLFIKVIPPLPIEPPTSEHAQQSDWYTSPEWWLVIVTIILAGITAILAGYTAKLWGATNALVDDAKATAGQQAKDMEKSLAIANESADAAKKSSEAAERTVNTMKDTAERQLRAYAMVKFVYIVNVDRPEGNINISETWVHVTFKNFGQIPATGVKYWVEIYERECPLTTSLIPGKTLQPMGAIAPGDTFTARTKLGIDYHLSDGRTALYVYGQLHYFDGFTPGRVSPFRYMRRGGENWSKNGELEACQQGNDPIETP